MYRLRSLNNSFRSYQDLINLYNNYKSLMFSDVYLSIDKFFAANMSAALGAILDKLKSNLNDIHFVEMNPSVELILSKNDFLTYFGKERAHDVNRTTIKFQKLRPKDGKFFKNYVVEELIEGRIADLPKMSQGVKDKIIEAIYEIFVNAQIHSETDFIYTCGQFFPTKNKIEFTIVDVGIGFREKINKRFGSSLKATSAIRWAVEEKKTTKEGITGGLGLAILKEFVQANQGKMQIISNNGFYEFGNDGFWLKEFNGEFPGTIVNLQFRTDDNSSYTLVSEIDNNEIF